MKIYDIIVFSIKNLFRRKLRTFLTILGIIIGVSTIVSLVSLSFGLKYSIEKEFEKMGKDTFIISSRAGGTRYPITGLVIEKFDKKIYQDIFRINFVKYAIGLETDMNYFRYKERTYSLTILLVSYKYAKYLEYFGISLSQGYWFVSDKCDLILGYNVYSNYFSDIKLGDILILNNTKCRVIGILKPSGNPLFDNSILIPMEFYEQIKPSIKDEYSSIFVITQPGKLNETIENVKKYLDTKRKDKYTIITMQTILETINSILGSISIFALSIAFVSLIISGIGISNTMFTNVLERRKEIALLKTFGMKNSEILLLFLFESIFMGLLGGAIGLVLGYIGALVLSQFISISTSITPYFGIEVILVSTVIPLIISILSGIIPAYRASKIDPLEVLKYE